MRLSEQIAEALLSEKTWAVPSYELSQIQKADVPTLRSLRKVTIDKLERLERGTTVGWGSSNYEIDHGQTTAKLKAIDDRLKQLGESRLSEAKPPYFQCQECGKTLPETARKCSKCGSSDIDLYVPPKK